MTRSDEEYEKAKRKFYMGFVPAGLALIAIVCSMAAIAHCQAFSFTPITSNIDGENDALLYVGIYNYRYTAMGQNTCQKYEELVGKGGQNLNMDTNWKVSRVFGYISLLFGVLITLLACFAPCCCRRISPSTWKVGGSFFWIVAIFQGLTLLVIKSNACDANPVVEYYDYALTQNDEDVNCTWEAGIKMNIVGIVFWFLAGFVILSGWIQNPQGFPHPPKQTQRVTYQQTIHPDGSQTVEEVSVVKSTGPSTKI